MGIVLTGTPFLIQTTEIFIEVMESLMTSFEDFFQTRQDSCKFCMSGKRLSFLHHVEKMDQIVLIRSIFPALSLLRV